MRGSRERDYTKAMQERQAKHGANHGFNKGVKVSFRATHALHRYWEWIYAKALSDIAMIRGIDESAMDYALAKYATENATTTKYAYVNRKSDRARISGYGKVLINLQNLNHDNYYYVDGLFD